MKKTKKNIDIQKPYYTNDSGFQVWEKSTQKIISAINAAGECYEALGIGLFSREVFHRLYANGHAYLDAAIDAALADKSLFAPILAAAKAHASESATTVIDAIDNVNETFAKELNSASAYRYNNAALDVRSIPFDGNRAVFTQDYAGTMRREWFDEYFQSEEEAELYTRLSDLANEMNTVLSLAKQQFGVEYLHEVLTMEQITGEYELEPARFASL